MTINAYLLAKILGIQTSDPVSYFEKEGLAVLPVWPEVESFVLMSDAIRYVHASPVRLQQAMAYKPETVYQRSKQDELLCRCEL